MIYVLHGEDTNMSYRRLQALLNKHKDFEKIRLDEKTTRQDFLLSTSTEELLQNKKILICENFIHKLKININDIKGIPEGKNVIFWEKGKLSLKLPSTTQAKFTVEEFKRTNKIFYILDTISNNPINFLRQIRTNLEETNINLTWLITNRIYLLRLAKLNLTIDEVKTLTGKQTQNWQWQKITSQANNIEHETLEKIFNGLLKIDYLKKTSKTTLDEKTLISTLFLKYFRT